MPPRRNEARSMTDRMTQPLIVGIGGTTTPGSSPEQALSVALAAACEAGAKTAQFGARELAALPHYDPASRPLCAGAVRLVEAVRAADGLIIASPGYHGTISGLVKNALDYMEETARDARVYLDGLPVGLIATAYGWQATGGTLAALRVVAHALRGWPTPLGVAINTSAKIFRDGVCLDEAVSGQLRMVGRQVVAFALTRSSAADATRFREH
jgi:FMN reductase